MARSDFKKLIEKYDPEFRYLLEIDPAFEAWRQLAAEWLDLQTTCRSAKQTSITKFLIHYLHGNQLDKNPDSLLDATFHAPPVAAALGLDLLKPDGAIVTQACISDFIEWVLKKKCSAADENSLSVKAISLRNPFQRRRKVRGKSADVEFRYILESDPQMEAWRRLASTWLAGQRTGIASKREALDRFLVRYLVILNLERNPLRFFERAYQKPAFADAMKERRRQAAGDIDCTKRGTYIVAVNNIIQCFLSWALDEVVGMDGENGQRHIPDAYHNPVSRLTLGLISHTETLKTPLAYRYIRELRTLLAQGTHFREWLWAQRATDTNVGGDWFAVAPSLVDEDDPDCVWRRRPKSRREQEGIGDPAEEIVELWSPVRATALYLKLELPLRTFQVRMLDSGEADTWRYGEGKWRLNTSPLVTGSERRPVQRGVFHRSGADSGVGLYINTNKTADIGRHEQDKGYVIPWTHVPALYWLEKLRNWQEKYNPIEVPTSWRELAVRHFGRTPPNWAVLDERGSCCFLFRDAATRDLSDRKKPIVNDALDLIWPKLLMELQQRCAMRGECLDDGALIRFIVPGKSKCTYYPLHALRVSLITAYALDGGVPFPVLSKLIAGHARIIMTLYYTKAGKAHVTEIMQEADKHMLDKDAGSYRRMLMEKSYQEIEQKFAFNNKDALLAVGQQKSAAGLLFEDKGICPVGGGLCDIGGKNLTPHKKDACFASVPGYPQERNCIRCRFFLTGPAFLPGLQAHANWISYRASACAERYRQFEQQLKTFENHRLACEERGELFAQHPELERLACYSEEEADKANKLLSDFQAVVRLIDRCITIANVASDDSVQLVAVGALSDIEYALHETESEMHQLEILCENAVVYPGVDASAATLRRSQILDAMLQMNGQPPIFFRLSADQQLCVGNAVMKLISTRTGSVKNAVEFAEGKRQLADYGLLTDTVSLIDEKVASVGWRQIIDIASGVDDES